jgi:hypothetical protein
LAVGVAVALHALLGLGLLWAQPHGPPRARPQPQHSGATAAAFEDEPDDCVTYLIPAPQPKLKRADATPPSGAARVEPPLPQSIGGLPDNVPGSNVASQAPAPRPPQPPRDANAGNATGTAGAVGGLASTFFGLPAEAKKIVYVLDRSGSMGKNSLLERASLELLRSLEKMPPAAEFQVLVYNRKVELLLWKQPLWLTAGAGQRQLVAKAL